MRPSLWRRTAPRTQLAYRFPGFGRSERTGAPRPPSFEGIRRTGNPAPFGINEELRRCGRLAGHTSAGLGAGRSRRLVPDERLRADAAADGRRGAVGVQAVAAGLRMRMGVLARGRFGRWAGRLG